jgi:hypothetical protein
MKKQERKQIDVPQSLEELETDTRMRFRVDEKEAQENRNPYFSTYVSTETFIPRSQFETYHER